MKGSGTPMQDRRTHIPRFRCNVGRTFLVVEPSELNTNIQYTLDVLHLALQLNAGAKIQLFLKLHKKNRPFCVIFRYLLGEFEENG